MGTETLTIVLATSLLVLIAVAAAIALAQRGPACPACGRRLPRGAQTCPACEAERAPEEEPPEKETARPLSSSVELVVTQGPLAEQRFAIPAQGLTIGRHPDNDIVLPHELMISRHHAMIVLEQGQFILYDRDSANGTWVNGQRIFRHVLAPGDRIQIWQSHFAYAPAGAPPPPTPPAESVVPTVHISGESFAGYRLGPLIGRGGMSEVFQAYDAHGRIVAIKILQQTDPYLVAKFVQEGNDIGPLLRDHPNIIYVYEFGQSADSRLYIVMEYVEAPSLRKVIRQPWQERDIVQVVGQVCSALAFAHENNVVHRDIKPENILLTKEGRAKVLDFGIAKLTSASTVTRDKIVGTPEYISPEQARGEPVRPASDVYSLGIVLYEILAGSVPFRRPSEENPYRSAMEVIRQHLKERPEPIRKRNPAAELSPTLERVTMRALNKDVKARYTTAKEMGEALGYRESEPIHTSSILPMRMSLVILQGPRQRHRITLAGEETVLGRADLGSSNTTISRQHVHITFRAGRYWLQDMSKNGTWIDQQRVYGEVPLQTGALIAIGDNLLRFEREAA
jgi:serine/threonine protein kinase